MTVELAGSSGVDVALDNGRGHVRRPISPRLGALVQQSWLAAEGSTARRSVRVSPHDGPMLLAILICSDEDCDTTAEEVGSLEELDAVLCADCDCLMQIVAIEEAHVAEVVQLHRPLPLALAA